MQRGSSKKKKRDLRSGSTPLGVIGCGNLNRQDDGVGVHVIEALQRQLPTLPPEVHLVEAGTSGIDLMFLAQGCEELWVIDACTSDAPAGTLLELTEEELPTHSEVAFNSHDFRWDQALVTGRQLYPDRFPQHVKVFLVEAESVDYGRELSTPVSASAEQLIETLKGRILQRYPAPPRMAS